MANYDGELKALKELAKVATNEQLQLSARLVHIDAALRLGTITQEQLDRPTGMPTPSDYNLPSSTPVPDWAHSDFVSGIAYVIAAILFFSLWVTIPNAFFNSSISSGNRWLLGIAGAAGIGFLVYGLRIMRAIAGSLSPTYNLRQSYCLGRIRYDILAVCRKVKRAENDVNSYRTANGPEFERLVARAFRKRGYKVEEMGGANDGGVDLVVTNGGYKAIVQCKAHARAIPPATIRELYGTLTHSDATVAILASTNGPSKLAREWAQGKKILFLSPDDLIRGRGL